MFLKISQNSQENTCAWVSCRWRPATLSKIRLWHRCFPVNFTKFVKNTFLAEHLRITAPVITYCCSLCSTSNLYNVFYTRSIARSRCSANEKKQVWHHISWPVELFFTFFLFVMSSLCFFISIPCSNFDRIAFKFLRFCLQRI